MLPCAAPVLHALCHTAASSQALTARSTDFKPTTYKSDHGWVTENFNIQTAEKGQAELLAGIFFSSYPLPLAAHLCTPYFSFATATPCPLVSVLMGTRADV